MNNSENVPNINTAVDESTGHTTASGANGQIELLQRLGDRVMHDAEELAARIRKEAESEAARLIEDVNRQVREIINNAQKQAKAVSELDFNLKDIIGSVDTSEVEPSLQERTGETGVAVEVETEATSEPKFPQGDSELFYGEVKIDIAPPVKIVRLLGLMRSLQNTRGIRILGTSGSRTSGSVIAISLDKPLPLLSLLRDMPFVDGVKVEEKSVPSSAPEQSDVRMVSVATRDGGCVR